MKLETLKAMTPVRFSGSLVSTHTISGSPEGPAPKVSPLPAVAFVSIAVQSGSGKLQFIHFRQIHENEIELTIGGAIE